MYQDLPRGGMSAGPPPTVGEFRLQNGEVRLYTRNGEDWPADVVEIVQGSWGGGDDGIEALPRPAQYSTAGELLVKGDRVCVEFLNGSPQTPIVTGVVRRIKHTDFLTKTYQEAGGASYRVRARVEPRDAEDAVLGRVDARICDNADGTFDLRTTTKVVLRVGQDTEAADDGTAYTEITIDDGVVTVNSESILLGASATRGVAREDDSVAIGSLAGSVAAAPGPVVFVFTPTGGVPITNVPPAGVPLSGSISSSSAVSKSE